ncbi:MAG TPA: hypothetical protein VK402_07555 [Blastococcus sp.]|nr:hypothetical protein [Blastococcus sp.]
MTEPSPSRPVPGPPRPVPGPGPAGTPEPENDEVGEDRFADLTEKPVSAHVDVFETEHSRLQRELGTIDQL